MLTKNVSNHWELPSGWELHSGYVVEVFLYGAWRPARVEYFYEGREYGLFLFEGHNIVGFLLINQYLQIRKPER